MFSILGESTRLCDDVNRREWLRVGGIGMLGLSLPDLLRSDSRATVSSTGFGQAKNVIFLWLQGGPPQHETFDPKPDAPREVRGEFQPIATNVPGIQISELLPRTATIADKYAVVRSLVTGSNKHSASGYHILTGYPYQGVNARQISSNDWPYFGSIVKMLKPSTAFPAYSTVWLPDVMRLNDNVMPAGQTAGFLGPNWESEKVVWDDADPGSAIQKFKLPPEIPPVRLSARKSLLGQLDRHFRRVDGDPTLDTYDRQTQEAFSVLTSGRALSAFDVRRESAQTRQRYGRSKWGQCVLLARRLIEAGVRLVHVNWVREDGDNAVDNPMWDTHAQNADRLQDVLCPQFDIGFSALIEDLQQRGLLDETLVVAIGEFGRTPKINAKAGRDHWGNVSSFLMAGAGIRTAQVVGASDTIGGNPVSDRIEPQQLTATLFHLLGIGHDALFHDAANRPYHVTQDEPIHKLLGTKPNTDRRRQPEGDVALVPSYTTERLRNTAFEDKIALQPTDGSKRVKGWKAVPLTSSPGLVVRLVDAVAGSPQDSPHVQLGFGFAEPAAAVSIPHGSQAILTQEIRNPRSGQFTLSVAAGGGGDSADFYNQVFLGNFSCRLTIFRYSDSSKDVQKTKLLGQSQFQPGFTDLNSTPPQRFELSEFLGTSQGNANFAIGSGLGIAVIVEKTSPGTLRLPPGVAPRSAFIRINEVRLEFVGKRRLPNQK